MNSHYNVMSLVQNRWVGVPSTETDDYELLVVDAQTTTKFLSCWDDLSFKELADPSQTDWEKRRLVETLDPDVPILVIASYKNDDIVVIDGNHRLVAVAVRLQKRMAVPNCIGVFLRKDVQ